MHSDTLNFSDSFFVILTNVGLLSIHHPYSSSSTASNGNFIFFLFPLVALNNKSKLILFQVETWLLFPFVTFDISTNKKQESQIHVSFTRSFSCKNKENTCIGNIMHIHVIFFMWNSNELSLHVRFCTCNSHEISWHEISTWISRETNLKLMCISREI